MKKLLGILVLGLLWCNVSYASVFKLNKCYENKVINKGNIWGPQDKIWNKKSWEKFRINYNAGKPILNYYLAKEYLPENIDKNEFHKKAMEAGYYDGIGAKSNAKEKEKIDAINFFEKYSLFYEEMIATEDNYFSINFDTGKIRFSEVFTEEYLNKRIENQKIKKKWKKAENPSYVSEIFIEEETRDYTYIISDYTENTVISKYEKIVKPNQFSYPNGALIETDYEINLINGVVKKKHKVTEPKEYFYERTQYICLTSATSVDGSDTSVSSGTAFFINNRGHLLTNNHVIEGCALSKISYKNKNYETKLIATDKTLDLALLKAEIRPNIFFNFSKDEAKKLSKVYVAGYPLGKGLSDDLKISSGIVSSLKGFEDNSNEIQIDAPINPGNSGGPIINENGDLIAIAVSGLAKDLTEGINFGIKASAAENFLKSNKINPKKSMYSGIKDNDKLLKILEEGTVYTFCN